jgi:two-component system cell cycle sensor histidine kinase/response regulator CckA
MPRKDRAPKSERSFHNLLETLPLIVYSVEPTPPYAPLYLTQAIETLGYTRQEWLDVPDRWIQCIHPDDRERVLAASERAFARREPLDDEYRMITRDGAVRWFHDRGAFVLDKKGKVVEWHGVMVDITERKQAELRLMESEERYRRLIESSPDAIFVHNKGRILFANPAAATFFGARSAEALAGVSVARLVHGHSRKDVGPHVKEVLNKGKTNGPVELRWVTLDGRMVDSEVTGSKVTVNGRTAVQVTARDTSARRTAHEELRKALALLEATIESTTDGILVVDTDGRMVRMNNKFIELWRLPPDVVASRDDAKAIAFVLDQLEDPEAFVQKIQELNTNPDAESLDTLRFKDGRVYERTSKPQRVGEQTVGRVWGFRDVTRRLELEGQVRQAQKMDAIGSLAGGVAHDFNNILTVIRGNVELMLTDTNLPDVHRGDLGVVYGAAERAMELTRQLLAFSRKQVVHPVALDLGAVVRELEPMLRRLIGEDIAVDTTLEPSTTILADRAQIEQVLLNLAVNGRDAMPRGGTLTIHTAHVDVSADRRLRGATIPAGRYVALEVEDTGLGIAPHHIDRVFEPFFTTKEAGRGTGLGLATVYGIVKQSNGFVDVESWLGAGTAFRILLPAVDQRPTSRTAEFPVVDVGSGRVLVVEDEFAVRQFVRRALEKRGYEILQAASGPDAIELVRSQSGALDLIVTDVVMPGMSGARLIQELRQMGVDAPVLYMSGYTDDEVIRRGVKHSEVLLLAKPFTAPQLAAAVQKAMCAAKASAAGVEAV